MTESGLWAVVQTDRDSDDPMVLARALAAVRKEPVQDQVLAAKSAWGIVADDLSKGEAKSLGQALRAHGVECTERPTAALPRLPDVERAKTVDALLPGRPVLIAVAAIPGTIRETTETKVKGAYATRMVYRTETEHTLDFYGDLYYEDPARRMRIDASAFNFSGLGDRKLLHGQANLKLLLEEVVRAAPEAWTNHGTRVLLEGKPIRTIRHRSLDDLDREARWLLALRGFGRP